MLLPTSAALTAFAQLENAIFVEPDLIGRDGAYDIVPEGSVLPFTLPYIIQIEESQIKNLGDIDAT